MGGFFGFGQSGGEKASTGNLNNIFNYALPTAETGNKSGTSNLGTAADYFSKLLTAGRTETTQSSAPAVNAALDTSDAARKEQAVSGTGRTGGTAELNREAGAKTTATIDDIINKNLMGGKAVGSEGLTKVGGEQLANAAQLLGIGSGGQQTLYSGALNKEGNQTDAFSKMISAFI
jgi:hypothetical protein